MKQVKVTVSWVMNAKQLTGGNEEEESDREHSTESSRVKTKSLEQSKKWLTKADLEARLIACHYP